MATILVVDDEPVMLKLCANVMILGHHDVLKAAGGQEALQILQNSTADLALLDVMMPGMNGVLLAKRIQRMNPDMKIILMTGYGPAEIANIAGKENPYRIIWKPFKAESLLRMIDNVLSESAGASG